MSDRSDEFRKAANECLELARNTTDATTRVSLLTMAQKWFDLANGLSSSDGRLDTILRDFNDDQMSGRTGSRPVMQQQQQVQPKKEE